MSFPTHCVLFSCFWMLSPNFTKTLGFNIHFYSCDPWVFRCLPDTSIRLGHYYSKNNILPWNFIFMIYIYYLRLRSCYPSTWYPPLVPQAAGGKVGAGLVCMSSSGITTTIASSAVSFCFLPRAVVLSWGGGLGGVAPAPEAKGIWQCLEAFYVLTLWGPSLWQLVRTDHGCC